MFFPVLPLYFGRIFKGSGRHLCVHTPTYVLIQYVVMLITNVMRQTFKNHKASYIWLVILTLHLNEDEKVRKKCFSHYRKMSFFSQF